jgi:hypothetical protein
MNSETTELGIIYKLNENHQPAELVQMSKSTMDYLVQNLKLVKFSAIKEDLISQIQNADNYIHMMDMLSTYVTANREIIEFKSITDENQQELEPHDPYGTQKYSQKA